MAWGKNPEGAAPGSGLDQNIQGMDFNKSLNRMADNKVEGGWKARGVQSSTESTFDANYGRSMGWEQKKDGSWGPRVVR